MLNQGCAICPDYECFTKLFYIQIENAYPRLFVYPDYECLTHAFLVYPECECLIESVLYIRNVNA